MPDESSSPNGVYAQRTDACGAHRNRVQIVHGTYTIKEGHAEQSHHGCTSEGDHNQVHSTRRRVSGHVQRRRRVVAERSRQLRTPSRRSSNPSCIASTGRPPDDFTGSPAVLMFLLWVLAVILVIAGIVSIVRGAVILGIVLIIVGLLVGPGGVSIFDDDDDVDDGAGVAALVDVT